MECYSYAVRRLLYTKLEWMGYHNARVLWTLYSFILRYCRGTEEEDKATGHRAKSPVTPRTKGDMTVWVVTEIAHGIHLVPSIRVSHRRYQETLVNGARLTLQGPMELVPAWSPTHPSPHSRRGSPSANPGPLILKLWTLEGNSSWPLSSIPYNSTWLLDFRKPIVRFNNKKKFTHITFYAILHIFGFFSYFSLSVFLLKQTFSQRNVLFGYWYKQ